MDDHVAATAPQAQSPEGGAAADLSALCARLGVPHATLRWQDRPATGNLAEAARAEGFAAMGVCRPDAIPEAAPRLARFLEAGRHGDMGWMEARSHWAAVGASLCAIAVLSLVLCICAARCSVP